MIIGRVIICWNGYVVINYNVSNFIWLDFYFIHHGLITRHQSLTNNLKNKTKNKIAEKEGYQNTKFIYWLFRKVWLLWWYTARPWYTRSWDTQTLKIHSFELGPKTFEICRFWTNFLGLMVHSFWDTYMFFSKNQKLRNWRPYCILHIYWEIES